MIKKIITYPTPTGIEYTPDVRVFDDELYSFIDDLITRYENIIDNNQKIVNKKGVIMKSINILTALILISLTAIYILKMFI